MTTRGYEDPLVEEALRKSTIVWLQWKRHGIARALPIWYVKDGDRLLVLSGERQQRIPAPAELRNCTIAVRSKGRDILLAELPVDLRVIGPESEEWDDAAIRLAEKRLNIPGLPQETAHRWRTSCVILELTLRRGEEEDPRPGNQRGLG